MKKYILLFAVLFISAYSFATGVAVDVEQLSFIDALKENWQVVVLALIGLAEVIVKLTPTEKDNSILKKILDLLFFFIPNLKKGGGTHK